MLVSSCTDDVCAVLMLIGVVVRSFFQSRSRIKKHLTLRNNELLTKPALLPYKLPRGTYDDVSDDVIVLAKDLSKTLRLPPCFLMRC